MGDRAKRDEVQGHRERSVQVYKEGENPPSSGFQKGDEIWEKGYLQKLHPIHPGEQECLSSVGYCGEEGGWASDFSKSNQTIYSRIFSPSQTSDQQVFGYSLFCKKRVFDQLL
jgi:hypothetical protein